MPCRIRGVLCAVCDSESIHQPLRSFFQPSTPGHLPTFNPTPNTCPPPPLDGFFLAARDDQLTCEPCDASSMLTNLLVPALIGIAIIALVASCLHPAGQRRYVAAGRWLRIEGGSLVALQGKAGLFCTLGQTVSGGARLINYSAEC